MATTAGDIITAAFIKVGVDSPTAAQTTSALISLNNLISMLGADMTIPYVTRESFSVVAADSEYTVGSGGQWDTVRPINITNCFLRDTDNYDYPIKIISSGDYNRLSNKSFSARPSELYFVPEYPLAKIIFNTSPDTTYDAYLEFVKNFTEFALTTTAVSLPNEYKEFFVYNLAVSLGEDWDRAVSKTVFAQAARTREIIERMIASTKPIRKARFEFGGLAGAVDTGYSIVTDELIDGGAF